VEHPEVAVILAVVLLATREVRVALAERGFLVQQLAEGDLLGRRFLL
jgi:hypothetical protein